MNKGALFGAVEADRKLRVEQLRELVSYPSLAFPGYNPKPSKECAQVVARMLAEVGFADACIEVLDIGGQNPLVWAEQCVDNPDAPTLLLYAHYDVQPAPIKEQGWTSDPFTLVEREGRLFGRGAADDKAGIVQHLSALRAVGGVDKLPLNIKVCFEGEEEYSDSLCAFIPRAPARFAADAFVVCDGGNLEIGKPVLETSLRGVAEVTLRLRTVEGALHSGAFGGPVPDAFVALTFLLRSLYDDAGNTVIDGVASGDYEGSVTYDEDLLRRQAAMLDDVQLAGSGSVASCLWKRPSVTVIGLDMPSVNASSNIIIPEVRARISLRFPPGQTADQVLSALKTHLRKHIPWGAELSVEAEATMNAFAAQQGIDGSLAGLMRDALSEAFGVSCGEAGSGGSIPLLEVLQHIAPEAEFLIFGPIDSELAKMHGGNESVDECELENCVKAEALFLTRLVSN